MRRYHSPQNLINLIVFTSIFVFMGCKNPFKSEMIPGQQYTVSGYLTPFNTDSVWADTNIYIAVYYERLRKDDNSHSSYLGMGTNEEYWVSTDSNGYFEFQYYGPDQVADEDYPFYNIVRYVAMWVVNENEENRLPLLYTCVLSGCNVSNFNFVYDRFREVNAPKEQGICD